MLYICCVPCRFTIVNSTDSIQQWIQQSKHCLSPSFWSIAPSFTSQLHHHSATMWEAPLPNAHSLTWTSDCQHHATLANCITITIASPITCLVPDSRSVFIVWSVQWLIILFASSTIPAGITKTLAPIFFQPTLWHTLCSFSVEESLIYWLWYWLLMPMIITLFISWLPSPSSCCTFICISNESLFHSLNHCKQYHLMMSTSQGLFVIISLCCVCQHHTTITSYISQLYCPIRH